MPVRHGMRAPYQPFRLYTELPSSGGATFSLTSTLSAAGALSESSLVTESDSEVLASVAAITETVLAINTVVVFLGSSISQSQSSREVAVLAVIDAVAAAVRDDTATTYAELLALGMSSAVAQQLAGVYQQSLVLAVSAALQASLAARAAGSETELVRLMQQAWAQSTIANETFTPSAVTSEAWEGP